MRLTPEQTRIIRTKVKAMFGSSACVSLFGSRLIDTERGGDIDLYVEVDHALENRAASASRLAAELQLAMGDQRIDVVVVDPNTAPQQIYEIARKQGIAL